MVNKIKFKKRIILIREIVKKVKQLDYEEAEEVLSFINKLGYFGD